MKKKDNRILRQRKRKLSKRLERKQWPEQARPMLRARNIQYEMAERTRAIDCGAIGAFHLLARKTGLIKAIDESLHLLKRHLPYHESDHVLNLAYNSVSREGTRVQRGMSPARGEARAPVAWMAGGRETDSLKPIDKATCKGGERAARP